MADYLANVPAHFCTTFAGTGVGTTTTLTTASAQIFSLLGKAYSKAGVANEATPTVDIASGVAFRGVLANQGSVFALCRDSAGTLRAVQGSIEALDAQGNFINAPQFGAVPMTVCPFAYVVVKAGASASTWTFGVSNFSGPPTGVTFGFQDVMTLPQRPQVA